MTKHITKDILLSITQDINDALKAVAQKHGVEIRAGGGTYADKNATIKTTISVIDKRAKPSARRAKTWTGPSRPVSWTSGSLMARWS